MSDINKPVIKKDHIDKISGTAKYLSDIKFDNLQYAVTLRSTVSHGKINKINIPKLHSGYSIIDYRDVPGQNLVHVVSSEQPIFAENEVTYIGQPILLVVGPNKKTASQIRDSITVDYEKLPALLSLEESNVILESYSCVKGEPQEIFKNAQIIHEETFSTGYQEQLYLETQGAVGIYKDERIHIYGGMQCPYYVHTAVMEAMGFEADKVRVVQTVTGGAFGGKEDYPSHIAAQVAIAAYKIKKPVQIIFDRREDIEVTTKRHPAILNYRAALGKDGDIKAFEISIKVDAGAYLGLSAVVLQRAILASIGVYNIENVLVTGSVMMTNTVPNGAYRGFGSPQSFFAIESFMNHLSKEQNIDPIIYRRKYFVKKGDLTVSSGKFHGHVPIDEMIKKAEELSNYSDKHKKYLKQTGRYKKGIGMSIVFHGGGFTGSTERDVIKSVVKLEKKEDDTVEVLAANAEIGQGIKTTFCKIAAKALNIPYENVYYSEPDTDKVPNSGPTVASRSIMIPGKLVERAAEKLRKIWKPGKRQLVEENYVHPDLIPWDIDEFRGDAYLEYSWGVNVIEVETDTLLAQTKIIGIYNIFDVGNAIDDLVIKGQIEGGVMQGIGYASMENMKLKDGKIYQNSITDYIIPTSKDTTFNKSALIDNYYEGGPYGAKGAGELTIVGAAPAYTAAVENALDKRFNSIPLTPEKIMEVL